MDQPLRQTLAQQLKAAIKARDSVATGALRMAQAALANRDIEERTKGDAQTPDDARVIEVVRKLARQRRESIAMFRNAGRADRAAAEEAELAVLERLLPPMLDDEAAKDAIAALVTEAGARGPGDMGRVMGLVRERLGDRIDMGRASAFVRQALGPQ